MVNNSFKADFGTFCIGIGFYIGFLLVFIVFYWFLLVFIGFY